MPTEVELKFEIKGHDFIRKILKKSGAKFIGKAFERTFKFDTKNLALQEQGKFLRLRNGFKDTLTFKQKINRKSDTKLKEREEIELEISDLKKMEKVLEKLGFTKKWIMEKFREKWQWGSVEIVIDKLPFGNFIEIEGDKKSIQKTAKLLGFRLADGITDTYWGLWRDYCKQKGIKKENIVF